jgi:hypothetical protein
MYNNPHNAGLNVHTAPNKRRFPSVYAGTTAALKKTLDYHHLQAASNFAVEYEAEPESVSELQYYIDTASIIFTYYDVVENNADAEYANNTDSIQAASSNPDPDNTIRPATQSSSDAAPNSIMRYFSMMSESSEPTTKSGPERQPSGETQLPQTVCMFRQDNRASLLEQYMCRTTPSYVKNASILQSTATSKIDETVANMCEYCGSADRTVIVNDGIVICNDCATVEYVIIDHERPSYKEPPKEISYFAYKRINHLNEWLNQVQGKETTDIPDEIYDKIYYEIKKRKITNMADITPAKLKSIMRKLEINKYYEHIPHIMYRLNGVPVPVLPPELEEKVRSMFKQIQVPFLKYSPPTRKNFLSYSYVLCKFMQLLEEDEYLPYFPLLKSREKLQAQDSIWKHICKDLNWQFIKSL